MIRFKLTTQEKTTHGGYKLPTTGAWFYPEDQKGEPAPCTSTVLHHYAHPVLALLLNPIHADISNPRLFKIQVAEELGTDGLKGWSRAQRIVEELDVPQVTSTQRTAFAIKAVLLVDQTPEFIRWATDWLSGKDRTYAAADAAADAADAEDAAYAAAAAARAAARTDAAYADAAYAAAAAAAAAADAEDAAYAAAAAARAAATFSAELVAIAEDVISNF